MDLRLSFPALLLCLVFLMCGGGNAVRDLEEKYATAYFHKTLNSADQFNGGDDVENLKDKYSTAYFHKTLNSADQFNEGDDVKNLKDKYSTAYFHKTLNSADHINGDDDVKNFKDKYSTAYFHKTLSSADHINGGDDVKSLKDKYSTAYFHKTLSSADHINGDDDVKNFKDKYSTAYFHKTLSFADHINGGDDVKSLKDKYSTAYFHKTLSSAHHNNGDDDVKNLKDKYSTAYFHKALSSTNHFNGDDDVKSLEDKYSTAYFHKTLSSANHFNGDDDVKILEDKYSTAYFHKPSQLSSKMMKDHHHHDESAEIGLFSLDELRAFVVGKKLPIFFPIKNHSLYPPFLPKQFAETIPFSSSQVSKILQFFSISPDSSKGKAVQDTLRKCQLEAAQGETKICATSLESLHAFLSNAFGPEVDFNFISTTHPTITTPIFQNYTISETPQEIESPKKVACHPMPYLYAVHFCHFDDTETKAFKLQLVGDITGDKVDALVLCHMDTSGWSSDHTAFRMLGIKQGDAVCHVFSQGNVVWIQSSAVSVSVM